MSFTGLIRLLRIPQWLKNLMLYFPPFLGGILHHPGVAAKGALPFALFCCASSGTYAVNDLLDAGRDAGHPKKSRRPVASGEVSPRQALFVAAVLFASALFGAFRLPHPFFLLLSLYVLISIAYSLWLKHVPLLDLSCISAGFVIRLMAGGAALGITVSEWLFLSVFLLSIFLSTGKRLAERSLMGEDAVSRRYPEGFLDGTMYLTAAAVLVAYSMYAVTRELLVYTVPLCTFGLLRYIFLVKSGKDGDPTSVLLRDPMLFTVGFLWAAMVGWTVYFR